MPIAREFHDWQRPALSAAAEWLINRCGSGHRIDMDHVVVVVPGSRAGRRLREILLVRLDQRQLAYSPPSIITIGQLPELLYQPKRRFASELTQQLAWARALCQAERARVQQVIPVLPVGGDDDPRWIELGGILRGHHRELAADGLDFVQVARQGAQLEGFDESQRWEILAEIQARYLQILDSLQLWDRQTARLEAIKRRECTLDDDIVLLGMVDMNHTLRRMLDQVADRVTALVHAPPAWADRFDPYGCLDPPAWQELPIGLDTGQIRLVDGPLDQVEEASRDRRLRRGLPGRPDHDRRAGRVAGASSGTYAGPARRAWRWGPGQPVTASGPSRLLKAVAAWLQVGAYTDFAALVRHPAVVQWLERQGHDEEWLTELDRYYTQHLPARLDGPVAGSRQPM